MFLQDGKNDLNIYSGSWYLANQAMASALEYAGYESKFVVGTEAHNSKHGSAILPDALRWLWRDYPQADRKSRGSKGDRHYITEILDPGIGLGGGERRATASPKGPAVDREGNVFFTDIPNNRIHKIGARRQGHGIQRGHRRRQWPDVRAGRPALRRARTGASGSWRGRRMARNR